MSEPLFDALHHVCRRILDARHRLVCLNFDSTLARHPPEVDLSLLPRWDHSHALRHSVVNGSDGRPVCNWTLASMSNVTGLG